MAEGVIADGPVIFEDVENFINCADERGSKRIEDEEPGWKERTRDHDAGGQG